MLDERKSSDTIFLSIFNGNLARRITQDTPGAVARTNKKGVTVHEKFYNRVGGIITGIKIESTDFGTQLKVTIRDNNETYGLSFPVESRYFDNFATKIGAVNLAQVVEIAPFRIDGSKNEKKPGQAISGLNFYQGGNKLGYFITKENLPAGYPPYPEKVSEDDFKLYLIQKSKWHKQYLTDLGLKIASRINAEGFQAPAPGGLDADYPDGAYDDNEAPF